MVYQAAMAFSFSTSINAQGFASDVLHFPSSSAATPSLIVLFIPGNPGLPSYYTSFLSSLLSDLPPTTAAYSLGHLGHSPTSKLPTGVTLPTLTDQVQHKLEFIDGLKEKYGIGKTMEEVGEGTAPKFVIISHSIGSWISLKLLSQRPALITSLHNLFPTISDMATTPNGKRLSPLFSPVLHLPLSLSTGFLSYIPTSILSPIIGLLTPQTDLASRATTTSLVQSPSTVISALSMAWEEMEQVTSLDPIPLRKYGGKIRWYWAEGSSDGWVSPKSVDEICGVLDEAGWGEERRLRCEEGLKHAFVLEKRGTESLAKRCARWIKVDLGI